MSHLNRTFANEADSHEEHNGNNIVVEGSPVVDFECRDKGSYQHKENRTRTQNRTAHQHHLKRDTIIFYIDRYR